MSGGQSTGREDSGGEREIDVLGCGTTFHRYEIVRLIGDGGMGSVYEALHIDL